MQAAFDLKLGDIAAIPGRNRDPWVVRVDKIEPAGVNVLFDVRLRGVAPV